MAETVNKITVQFNRGLEVDFYPIQERVVLKIPTTRGIERVDLSFDDYLTWAKEKRSE